MCFFWIKCQVLFLQFLEILGLNSNGKEQRYMHSLPALTQSLHALHRNIGLVFTELSANFELLDGNESHVIAYQRDLSDLRTEVVLTTHLQEHLRGCWRKCDPSFFQNMRLYS